MAKIDMFELLGRVRVGNMPSLHCSNRRLAIGSLCNRGNIFLSRRPISSAGIRTGYNNYTSTIAHRISTEQLCSNQIQSNKFFIRSIHNSPLLKSSPRDNLRLSSIGLSVLGAAGLGTGLWLLVSNNNLIYSDMNKAKDQKILVVDEKPSSGLDDEGNLPKVPGKKYSFLRGFFYEPIATFFRFIFLLILFSPLLATFPITYFGTQMIIDSSVDSATGAVNTVKIRYGEQLWYSYITWAMEHAGPSFIKLGQWAASRTDIFPEGLCLEMAKLHSNAKQHSFHKTKLIIEKSFGNGILFDDIFEEFISQPMGVGAIAQVYKAKLRKGLVPIERDTEDDDHDGYALYYKNRIKEFANTIKHNVIDKETTEDTNENSVNTLSHTPSKWVAIKVIHPGIDVIIERDLTIMRVFANFINWLPNMEWLSLPGEVEVFAQMMRTQLDLRIEANNLLVFRHNFAKKNDIKFPRPFIEYSSKRVLVEEFITGISMEKLLANAQSHKLGSLEREASGKALDSFLKMMLLDNFIHSDLHPGNIMVRFYRNSDDLGDISSNRFEDGVSTREINEITYHLSKFSGNKEEWGKELKKLHDEGYHTQVCFIDTGLVTVLNEKNRHNFLDLFKAISEFDGYRAGELMIERSRTPDSAQNPEIFSLRVQKLVRNIKDRTFAFGNVRLDDLLGKMLGLVRLHHVRMECDFITVILSIMLIEGIGRQLNPDLDLFKSSLPILRQVSAQERSRLLKDADVFSMLKIWALLEIRQLISASVNDINTLVKYDWLAPNT